MLSEVEGEGEKNPFVIMKEETIHLFLPPFLLLRALIILVVLDLALPPSLPPPEPPPPLRAGRPRLIIDPQPSLPPYHQPKIRAPHQETPLPFLPPFLALLPPLLRRTSSSSSPFPIFLGREGGREGGADEELKGQAVRETEGADKGNFELSFSVE